MWKCPKCGRSRLNVYFREIICRTYVMIRPGDEWENDNVVETEACVRLECANCGIDQSKHRGIVKKYASHTSYGYMPIDTATD